MEGFREGRRSSEAALLDTIKKVVAAYSNAPEDIETFTWLHAPSYWDRLAIPGAECCVEPRHEDRHAGVAFRVGWNQAERVAVLWIL